MFYLFVNGSRVHDEGEHDAQMRVTREGGGDLTFATKADGEAKADALFAEALARFKRSRLGRFRGLGPKRSSYVVAEEAPTVPDPEPAPEQAPEA